MSKDEMKLRPEWQEPTPAKEVAHRRGVRADKEGKCALDNPYPMSDPKHREWLAGFVEGRMK